MDSYSFQGTERFRVLSHLGSGGAGDVYRVFDKKRRTDVALKTLIQGDPAELYRFKREFRTLAELHHPNLVELYELFAEDDRWFFTMELIEGGDFLEHVRGENVPHYGVGPPPDFDRLRETVRQLVDGLVHLHDAGKLHCDIKPTNLRVTHEGRAVLLDFGMVRDTQTGSIRDTAQGEVSGTPAYMSPEVAKCERPSPASDWYSLGVVLFEALTGRPPFSGTLFQLLRAKQVEDAPSPRELVAELPDDLCALCEDLLSRDPSTRPTAEDIRRRLGRPAAAAPIAGPERAPFVGRRDQLAELRAARAEARAGKTVVVFLQGGSGIGKSTLIRHVLDEAAQEEGTVVLRGKCYERESVPYKALDALVDELGRWLRQMPREEVEPLLPDNVQALARLFPVLGRVDAVADAGRERFEIPDAREQRRRARAALRQLLERLAERHALVLAIDDLQWGDRDSADLLVELLRAPSPPLLLVLNFRDEERAASPLLQRLDEAEIGSHLNRREILLEALPDDEALELALTLLGGKRSPVMENLAREIVKEAAGSPYFLGELARYARTEIDSGGTGSGDLHELLRREVGGEVSLDHLLLGRCRRLEPDQRRLLEMAAVAGKPLDLDLFLDAAGLGFAAQSALTGLRSAGLMRMRTGTEGEQIEVYHDRVGEALRGELDAETVRGHAERLAAALEKRRMKAETSPESVTRPPDSSIFEDPETLAQLYAATGETRREVEMLVRAADQAGGALAFDRAAALYRRALRRALDDPAERLRLRIALGDALADDGRGGEAAEAYLAAADDAESAARVTELRRRAAEQQLITGRIDTGLETLGEVLSSVGLKLTRSAPEALLTLLYLRLRLKLRGLEYEEVDESKISNAELLKIDTCWSAAVGLSYVDTLRGMVFGVRHLLLALDAGEPYRLARALAIEAGYSGAGGVRARPRTRRLGDAAMRLAEHVGKPHARGLVLVTTGVAAFLEGRWRKAADRLAEALGILRERCSGVTWEIDTSLSIHLRSLLVLGRLREMLDMLPEALEDMRARGDLYGETNLLSRLTWIAHLAADRPERGLEDVERARVLWSQAGFHIQHYWQLTGQVEIALYRGDGAAAWRAVEMAWPGFERAQLMRIQFTRAEALAMRSRAALVAGGAARRTLRSDLRRVEKEGLPWATALARLVRAGLATLESRPGDALEHLDAAATGFREVEMDLHRVACEYRKAQLLGDGDALAEAEEIFRGQGVEVPERFLGMMAPGSFPRQGDR